jgi:1,4-dihydroxy-2-naphthoate octaprenyltransferase
MIGVRLTRAVLFVALWLLPALASAQINASAMIWHLVLISLTTGATVSTLNLPSNLTDRQAKVACSKIAGTTIEAYLKANPSVTHHGHRTVKAACQKF